MTTPIFRTGPALDIKLAPDAADRGLIEGYGSTFDGEPDMHGDVIAPGAFTKALSVRTPAMLWGHDLSRPIGRWTEAVEDSRGLRLKGSVNLDTAAGQEAHAHLRAGDVTGLSIGFKTPPGGAEIDTRTGIRRLKEVDLYEVSPVAIPSNNGARITQVKTLGSERELKAALHLIGLPRAAAAKIASAGWSALTGLEDEPEIEIDILGASVSAAISELRHLTGWSAETDSITEKGWPDYGN